MKLYFWICHTFQVIREMLGNEEGSCSSSKQLMEDAETEEQMTTEQEDQLDTSQDDSMIVSDDVLDSSFASVGNDDPEIRENENSTVPVSCKMCKKSRESARMYQRKVRKLRRELKSCEERIKTLESEKRRQENIEKVRCHLARLGLLKYSYGVIFENGYHMHLHTLFFGNQGMSIDDDDDDDDELLE